MSAFAPSGRLFVAALAAAAAFAGAPGPAHAAPAPVDAVGFQLAAAPQVARGGRSEFALELRIAKGFAVLSQQLREPGLLAATVAATSVKGITVGQPRLPKGRLFKVGERRFNAYQGDLTVRIPVTVSRTISPGLRQVDGTLAYQVCSATECFDPVRFQLRLLLDVTD